MNVVAGSQSIITIKYFLIGRKIVEKLNNLIEK